MSPQKPEARGRRGHSEQCIPERSGLLHAGHSLGDRHLVGHPEPVAGRLVLCADGELSGTLPAIQVSLCTQTRFPVGREGKPVSTLRQPGLPGLDHAFGAQQQRHPV